VISEGLSEYSLKKQNKTKKQQNTPKKQSKKLQLPGFTFLPEFRFNSSNISLYYLLVLLLSAFQFE